MDEVERFLVYPNRLRPPGGGSSARNVFHLLRVRADSVVDLKPAGNPAAAIARLLRGEFEWRTTGPLLSAAQRAEDPCYSVKDPSIVYYEKRWHLF